MNTSAKPSQMQLQTAAVKLIAEKVLSKGGKMPSEAALKAAARTLADRAMRQAKQTKG